MNSQYVLQPTSRTISSIFDTTQPSTYFSDQPLVNESLGYPEICDINDSHLLVKFQYRGETSFRIIKQTETVTGISLHETEIDFNQLNKAVDFCFLSEFQHEKLATFCGNSCNKIVSPGMSIFRDICPNALKDGNYQYGHWFTSDSIHQMPLLYQHISPEQLTNIHKGGKYAAILGVSLNTAGQYLIEGYGYLNGESNLVKRPFNLTAFALVLDKTPESEGLVYMLVHDNSPRLTHEKLWLIGKIFKTADPNYLKKCRDIHSHFDNYNVNLEITNRVSIPRMIINPVDLINSVEQLTSPLTFSLPNLANALAAHQELRRAFSGIVTIKFNDPNTGEEIIINQLELSILDNIDQSIANGNIEPFSKSTMEGNFAKNQMAQTNDSLPIIENYIPVGRLSSDNEALLSHFSIPREERSLDRKYNSIFLDDETKIYIPSTGIRLTLHLKPSFNSWRMLPTWSFRCLSIDPMISIPGHVNFPEKCHTFKFLASNSNEVASTAKWRQNLITLTTSQLGSDITSYGKPDSAVVMFQASIGKENFDQLKKVKKINSSNSRLIFVFPEESLGQIFANNNPNLYVYVDDGNFRWLEPTWWAKIINK